MPVAGRTRPGLGIASTTVAVSMWGIASVLVKSIDGLSGTGVAFYRLLFGAIILTAVHVGRGGRLSRTMLLACVPGGVAFAGDILLFFTAVRETSIANATIIGALQPILLLPIGRRLFDEEVDTRSVVFSVVAVAGTALVVFGNTGAPAWSPTGDLLALGALGTWTAYFVVSKQARARLGALEYFTGLTIVALGIVAPFAFATGTDLSPAGPSDWATLIGVAVLSGSFGHVLLNWSHGHVPLQVMSLLTLLVPVVATIGAVVGLGEQVNLAQWGGMAVVVAALAVVVGHQGSAPADVTGNVAADGTPRAVA